MPDDKKVSELTLETSIVATDLLYLAKDLGGGVFGERKIQADNIVPLTTKGDLLVHNATVLARLPVGTNGFFLKADSVAGEGVSWAAELFTAAKDTKLSGIETGATADQTNAEIKTAYEANANTNEFDDAEQSKLAAIEALADVTDTANVTSAGALMDSEVDVDIKTLVLPANTTISTFGASLIDDVAAVNARATLEVQPTASPVFTGTLVLGLTTLASANFVINAANGSLELGNVSANTPFIDFHSSATSADYHARLIASGGTTVGTGTLTLTAAIFALGNTNLTITGGTIDGRDVAGDGSKLDGIEALADVTDTANVTSAGALMDSEVDADIKTLVLPASTTISAFGRTLVDDVAAVNARATLEVQPTASPTFTGTLTQGTNTTLTDGKLFVGANGLEGGEIILKPGSAETAVDKVFDSATDLWRFHSGGATRFSIGIDGDITPQNNIDMNALKTVDGRDVSVDGSKLDGIEALADVTDTTNVTAAGALMDSEVDADIKTLVLPASTTISAFGRTLVDDAAAINGRATLGVVIGTDVLPEIALVTQVAAEAGTETVERTWTAERVKQSIDALSGATLGTKQTATGTAIDFTGIPAGVKRIIILFQGVSLTGTDDLLIQLGDSVGFEATGYISSSISSDGGTGGPSNSITGFVLRFQAPDVILSGTMTLVRMDSSHLWTQSHALKAEPTTMRIGGGDKTLSDELTQIRITRTGANTFDAGSINILFE